jgi:hypothetical protein
LDTATLTASASPQSSVEDLLLHASFAPARLNNATPLLCGDSAKFELPIPHPLPSDYDQQLVSETASRLLFLSVHWIKNVKALSMK